MKLTTIASGMIRRGERIDLGMVRAAVDTAVSRCRRGEPIGYDHATLRLFADAVEIALGEVRS